MNIIHWLAKPIWNPSDNRSKKTIAFTFGIFVLFVLLLLEPFGIGYSITDLLFVCSILGYGILAFLTIYILEIWVKPRLIYFNALYIARGRIILWYLSLAFLMSAINYTYYQMVSWVLTDEGKFQPQSFVIFVYKTLAVALLPAIGLIIYFSRDLSFQQKLFKQLSLDKESLTIVSENKKTVIRVLCSNLLFIEARSNYVQVFYREAGTVRKELIRTTLRKLGEQLSHTPILRCHQSYMVNTTQIVQFQKNTRKNLLYLSGIKDPVPVSEKYLGIIEESLLTVVSL